MSEKVPWDTFWASPEPRDKEIAHKRWSQDKGKKENSFSGRYLHLKMISKQILRHAEMARDIKEWKMPTSKFGHFWTKTVGLPLGQNSIFGRKLNILLKAYNQISMSENVSWDSFVSPQGPGTKK